jgi:AcrR family transcriptional regulator
MSVSAKILSHEDPTLRQPQRLPAHERRKMLIDVAIQAFARKGYHSTTMEEVALGAGITKPVIYQHFRSKQELYIAILTHVGDAMIAAISNATATVQSSEERFERGIAAYFRFVYDHRTAFELIFGSSPRRDPEFRTIIASVEERIASNITSELDRQLTGDHRRLIASGVQALAEGIARRYIKEHSRELDESGRELPFDRSIAAQWSRQLSELIWIGVRGVQQHAHLQDATLALTPIR